MRQDLFRLVEGGTSWYFTSCDQDVVHAGNTYVKRPVKRTETESKNELSKANLEVTFGMDDTIARRWLTQNLDSVVTLTVFTKDTDTGTVSVIWKGRLSSVKPDMSTIKLVFESFFTSMRRPGLRARYQRNCRHVLYGRGCTLDKENFDVAGSCTAASGSTIVVSTAGANGDNWYTGGMVEAPDGTLRFIMQQTGTTLTLIRPIDTLNAAIAGGPQAVRIFPGCDRSRAHCINKFNNLLNNGSFPFIPTRNPFTGNSFI